MSLGNIDLTPQLVQAVRDAIDIVDIASEHTRLTPKGQRHEGLCPLHKEKTPSFSVDPDQGLYYCFGCGAGGDAIKLHMQLSGDDFPAAIETLALRYGIPLSAHRGKSRRRRDEPDITAALTAAMEYFRERLERDRLPRQYLEGRRIPPELAERFALGYAPDGWQNLCDALRGKVPAKDLIAAGLAGKSPKSGNLYDRFRHRLVFPIHNTSGRLVGFGGRTLGDDKAKYINTRETDRFHKGSLLYGLYQARKAAREGGRILLVEGYFDVIAAAAAGFDAAVASMGTSLTDSQARLLNRFAEEVVVGYDGDRAGEEAFRRALPTLLGEGLAVYRADFGEGHDPDSLRLEEGEGAVAHAIDHAPDGLLEEFERLTPEASLRDPQGQARAGNEIQRLLDAIPDPVLRFSYARRASHRLDVPEDVLLRRAPPPRRRDQEPAPAPTERTPGKAAEEGALRQLLAEGASPPDLDTLPPPEVFLDGECRNIFTAYRTLYGERGAAPSAKEVLATFVQGASEVDRVASILLQTSFGSEGSVHPADSLSLLIKRWRQQRLKQLIREIQDAQKSGDGERQQRLLQEKSELTRLLHGGSP